MFLLQANMTHENGHVILSSVLSTLSREANDCYIIKLLEIGLQDPHLLPEATELLGYPNRIIPDIQVI